MKQPAQQATPTTVNLMLWRCLFTGGLLFTLLFYGFTFGLLPGKNVFSSQPLESKTNSSPLQISTDLKDLSPEYLSNADARYAAEQLAHDIEHRLLLLVRGDKAAVAAAQVAITKGIKQTENIDLSPNFTELAPKITASLSPYRFQLLSAAQQDLLRSASATPLRTPITSATTKAVANHIADKAYTDLYQLDASLRITRFDQDPLAWFNDYLISTIQGGLSQQSSDSNSAQGPLEQDIEQQIISLTIVNGAMEMATQTVLAQQLDTLLESIRQDFSVDVLRSGIFFFASEAAQSSKNDISLITSISMLGVLVVLLLAFHSLWPLLLPFTSIALGVGFAVAVTHSLYGSIHILTIVFGASLIGIVIDYSLHYFYHLSDADHNDQRALHNALLLSLATSLIGYGALSLSGLDALKKVALFSCCGLSMAWLSVLCLGQFATRNGVTTDQRILPKILNWLSRPLQTIQGRKLKWLLGGIAALCLILCFKGITSSDDPRLFFHASTELLAEEQQVRQHASDYEPGRYLIISAKTVADTQQLAEQFFQQLERHTTVQRSQFNSVFNWVPTPAQQANNYALQSRLYADNGATSILTTKLGLPSDIATALKEDYQQAQSQLLSPKTLVDSFAELLPPFWFERPTQHLGLVLISKGTDLTVVENIAQKIAGVDYINTIAATTQALGTQRQSASKLLLIAYLLVGVLLTLRYRSFKATALLIIPISATIGFLTVFAILGYAITLFHTMALFLVLGLGMDYAIFAHDMQGNRHKTRQAILLSAITSLLSFGLLGLSSIPVVQAFGLTLLIGNGLNLFGALIYSFNRPVLNT